MQIPPELLTVAMSGMAGWVAWIHGRVNAHEEVIKKVDQLVNILLNDRLREREHD